ncbi:MAG: right-handed parallel beta-helix repeat-containing protein [Acidobacteriaceae bacterium]
MVQRTWKAGLALAAIACLGAVSARAQSFTVTDTSDSGSDTGSLRYALINLVSGSAANTNTITITATGTITLTSALPAIAHGVTIIGPGAGQLTVSGGNSAAVGTIFTINSLQNVSISGLTIANGNGSDNGNGDTYYPGGIYVYGNLTVNNCTFSGNSAITGTAGAHGTGGAIHIASGGALTVNQSTFTGNSAAWGGAINDYGTLTVSDSTFVGNSATGDSGAIRLTSGSATVTNSTFTGNFVSPGVFGGATYLSTNTTPLTLANNIFSGNSANGAADDIDYSDGSYIDGGGNIVGYVNGIGGNGTTIGLVPLSWYGGPTQTVLPQPGSVAICAGTLANATSAGLTTDQRGWPINTNQSCDSLHVDAGAVQSDYLTVTTLSDDSGSDSASKCPGAACSLRDAIDLALAATYNTNPTGADIAFLSSLSSVAAPGTIQLGGGLTIGGAGVANIGGPGANQLNIEGLGAGSNFSVFTVNSGTTASLYGLTVANGYSSGSGGIYNSGTLTVTNSAISGNSAPSGWGGGMDNNSGTLTLTDSTVSGNTAAWGGGIVNQSTLTLSNSTVTGNSAPADSGGGIYNGNGTLTVTSSTVTGNSAPSQTGGGIYVDGGTLTLGNSIVSGNTAGGDYDDLDDSGNTTLNGGNVVGYYNSPGTSAPSPAAQLSPLQLNGIGATVPTMIPLPGSPAICAGLQSNIHAGTIADERGYPNTNSSYAGYSSGSPCVDAGAVQTNYTGLYWVPQPANSSASVPSTVPENTAIMPAPAVEVQETDTLLSSPNNTDGVGGIPLTLTTGLTLSGGSSLSATTGPVTMGASTVNAAVFSSLTPTEIGSGFQLSSNLTVTPISVATATTLTASSSTFDVYGPAASLQVSAPSTATAGTSFSVSVTAVDSSGNTVANDDETVNLVVTGQSVSVGTATLSDGQGSGSVTLTAAPAVTLTGTGETTEATGTSNSITVSPVTTSQTITFTNPGTQAVGAPLTLAGTATSGLAVTFSSATTSVCTVSGTTATFIAAGTCTIDANQAGDSTYAAAPQVAQSFTVSAAAPPSFTLSSSPSAMAVQSGASGTTTLTVIPANGLTGTVSFACSGLPAAAICSFSPGVVTLSSASSQTTTLTIFTSSASASLRQGSLPSVPTATMAFAFCLLGFRKRNRLQLLLLLAIGVAGIGFLSGCGGPSKSSPVTSTVTVTATSGSLHQTTAISLTVN